MNFKEKHIEKIPTWSLCYLLNGDSTMLTEEEIKMVDAYCNEQNIGIISPIESKDGDYDEYFTHCPAFGLPCDVIDCIIIPNN